MPSLSDRSFLLPCLAVLLLSCLGSFYCNDMMANWTRKPHALFGLALGWSAVTSPAVVQGQFNNPPGVDIWCGKAYRAK